VRRLLATTDELDCAAVHRAPLRLLKRVQAGDTGDLPSPGRGTAAVAGPRDAPRGGGEVPRAARGHAPVAHRACGAVAVPDRGRSRALVAAHRVPARAREEFVRKTAGPHPVQSFGNSGTFYVGAFANPSPVLDPSPVLRGDIAKKIVGEIWRNQQVG
jgi:hypothetical protein